MMMRMIVATRGDVAAEKAKKADVDNVVAMMKQGASICQTLTCATIWT